MPGMLSHDLNQLAEIPRFNEACAGFLPVLSPIKAEPRVPFVVTRDFCRYGASHGAAQCFPFRETRHLLPVEVAGRGGCGFADRPDLQYKALALVAGGAVDALLDDGVDGDPVVIVRGAGLAGAGYEPEWGHIENAAGHELAG